MSSQEPPPPPAHLPPPLPPPVPLAPAPNPQWSSHSDAAGVPPKSKVWLWVLLAAGGCFVMLFVLGVLATILIPRLFRFREVAIQSKARADITEIMDALEAYKANNAGKYPGTLVPLVTPDTNGRAYLQRHIGRVPEDAWGHLYRYDAPNESHSRPRVYTLGQDNEPGGSGDKADIDSETLGGR